MDIFYLPDYIVQTCLLVLLSCSAMLGLSDGFLRTILANRERVAQEYIIPTFSHRMVNFTGIVLLTFLVISPILLLEAYTIFTAIWASVNSIFFLIVYFEYDKNKAIKILLAARALTINLILYIMVLIIPILQAVE